MTKLPSPMDANLGALDGLDFTHNGTMLNTQIRGDIPAKIYVTCNGVTSDLILSQHTELSGPADLAIEQMEDGSYLVVVPELTARDASPGDDEVTVLALPQTFDNCI